MAENIDELLKKKEQIYDKMFKLLDKIQFGGSTNKVLINGGNIKYIETINIDEKSSNILKKITILNRREGITLQQAMNDSFTRMQKSKLV